MTPTEYEETAIRADERIRIVSAIAEDGYFNDAAYASSWCDDMLAKLRKRFPIAVDRPERAVLQSRLEFALREASRFAYLLRGASDE